MAAEWHRTLAEVERSIEDCLASLDRYETAFAKVLAERGPVKPAEGVLWDARLAAASQATDEVERLLAEQDGVWNRWRETLSTWNGLIEQSA